MKTLAAIVVAILITIVVLFQCGFSEARGYNRRRKYAGASESGSREDGHHIHGGTHGSRGHQSHRGHHGHGQFSSESGEVIHSKSQDQGRGFWDDVGSLAKRGASAAYERAKNVDWKAVATKVSNIGAAAYNEAKKERRKRSYETAPLPAEQVIFDYLDDQEIPKNLYKKRSVRRFNMKGYLNSNNQFNQL